MKNTETYPQLTCEQCGAPLKSSNKGGYTTCDYCSAGADVTSRRVVDKRLREQLRVLREQWEIEREPFMDKGPYGRMLAPTNDHRFPLFTVALSLVWLFFLMGNAVGRIGFLVFYIPVLGMGIDWQLARKRKRIYEQYERLRSDYEAERILLVKKIEPAKQSNR